MLLSTHGILSSSFEEATPFNNTKSLEFDGVSDYVDMGDVLDFEKTDAFSLSYWFKVSSASSFYVVLGKSLTAGAGYMVWNQSSKINFRIRSAGGGQLRITANTSIVANTWTHCVITYDGSSLNSGLEMYINGSLESALKQSVMNSSSTLTTAHFNISGRNNGNSLFNGNIDEVSVFDSELSSSDVTSIYNNGVPNDISSLSPLSWYRMGDNDSHPTIYDNAGSNDGTMQNMTSGDIVLDVPPSLFSFQFDGVSDHFKGSTTYDVLDGVSKATWSIWFYPTSTNTFHIFFHNPRNTTSQHSQFLLQAMGTFRLDFSINTTSSFIRTTVSNINYNAWNHILICYDGTQVVTGDRGVAYINGIDSTNGVNGLPATIPNASNNLFIGENQEGYRDPWEGNLNNFSIWSGVDYRDKATQIYNSGVPLDLNNTAGINSPNTWFKMGSDSTWDGSKWTMTDVNGSYSVESQNMVEADRTNNTP